MTTSAYLATEIYHQREREMVQRLEWQRRATERAGSKVEAPSRKGELVTAIGIRIKGVRALVRHQPVRG